MCNSAKQPKALSCELCGEKLTQPHFYMGKIYGWSCIKKVHPMAKKTTNKANWQQCELREVIICDNGNKVIRVLYNGKKYKDIAILRNGVILYNAIIENNGSYFIDTLKFKK
jgi:hypothetical protein